MSFSLFVFLSFSSSCFDLAFAYTVVKFCLFLFYRFVWSYDFL